MVPGEGIKEKKLKKKNYETNRVTILSRTIVLSNAVNLFPETLLVYSRFIQVTCRITFAKTIASVQRKMTA